MYRNPRFSPGRSGSGHKLPGYVSNEVGKAGPDSDTDKSAESGDSGGFDEELHEDVAPFRAHGLADADLASTLGDGDEHDVHHADSAHQQGQARDSTHDKPENIQNPSDGAQQVLLAVDAEPRQVIMPPHQRLPDLVHRRRQHVRI